MDAAKSQTEAPAATTTTTITATPAVTSYPRMKCENGGSFMTNVKDYFNEFINTSMEDHKVCFKMTIHKMVDKFGGMTSSPKDVEHSATPQQASKEGA